jgi:hypothetical protein
MISNLLSRTFNRKYDENNKFSLILAILLSNATNKSSKKDVEDGMYLCREDQTSFGHSTYLRITDMKKLLAT